MELDIHGQLEEQAFTNEETLIVNQTQATYQIEQNLKLLKKMFKQFNS